MQAPLSPRLPLSVMGFLPPFGDFKNMGLPLCAVSVLHRRDGCLLWETENCLCTASTKSHTQNRDRNGHGIPEIQITCS